MKPLHLLPGLLIGLFLLIVPSGVNFLNAQATIISADEDTTQQVHILKANHLTIRTLNDSTKLTIIAGDVKLRQGTALFYCDSCVMDNNANTFEAWGKVHINDSDTTDIYSNHLFYKANEKFAYLDGGVKLTDGHATLTTPDLDYDMNTNVGIYRKGGKVINGKTVLTSQEGWYYSDIKDVYFKRNVVLKDPAYNIVTDSLLYNSESQTTRFISETVITDSNGRVIKTKEGYYNQQTGKAEFGQRPFIKDGDVEINANTVSIDDSTGISVARGNAVIVDKKNETTIIAGIIYRNKKTDAILATKKPLMIIKQEEDSIYITADTLFSARLTDLYKLQRSRARSDSTNNDSTLSQTVAGVSDSLSSGIAIDSAGNQEIAGDSTDIHINKVDSLATAVTPEDSIAGVNVSVDSLTTEIANDSSDIKQQVKETADIIDTVENKMPDSLVSKSVNPQTVFPELPVDSSGNNDSTVIQTKKGVQIVEINEKDSSNRYFEAYRNVRIYNDSLQAVCDSMFYSFKDSVFRLYYNPIVWAKESQITGDTIHLFTKNKKADKVEAYENGFLVNKVDSQAYNQIKATRMDGYFVNGDIDSVRARGFAESIYYIQDEDSAYTGINQATSDVIDIYFKNKELNKVVFRSAVNGTLWPIRQKSPSEMKLEGFRWLDERRPKSKLEMFE